MKLRLRGNSIRIRLSQSEVAALGEGQMITDQITFPAGNSLCFQLTSDDAYRASFAEETVLITVPKLAIQQWVPSEELSLSYDLPLSNGKNLLVLIEKDLQCRTERPIEDDSDAFPNPIKEKC